MLVSELEFKLTEIYNETHKDVLKYVVSKCNNPDDINDLVQNVYLNFCKRLRKNGHIDEPKKYLITIARNEIFKHYGFIKASREFIPLFSRGEGEDYSALEAEISTEDISYDSLLCDEVWEYVKKLDILTFKIFVLYFKYDMKLSDISKTLRVNESTVKSRLYRTIRDVRNKFNT